MKGVFWQNGQRIIRQVLDWFSASKDEIDQEFRQDYTQAGVVIDSLNEFEITVGDNNAPPTTHSININTGVAYDSLGQRIEIDDETISYDATNPTDTTDDGLGNFVLTPHSTGSKNVPLTANSFNYIWLDYLLVTDESVFTLQRATNAKQFYKQDDGYQITVTTVATPPTATSVYLGSVNLTGFGVVSGSTIDMSGRSSSLIRERRVKIKTPLANLSDATPTYGFNQELTLDDHVKAVGSGPVTPQNPHGTTLGDIGVDVENVVANHQKFMHDNGMIGDKGTILSSLYTEFHQITPGDDFVVIKKLLSTEVVNIDGITITSSDVPNDTTFLFSSVGDAGGTYYIYLDKFTKSLVRTTVNPGADVTKFTVASMVWTPGFTPLFDGDLTSITDLRVFGTINNDKIDNEDTYEVSSVGVHDGSVSSPALFWRSDTDTGIYRSGSGVISFTSNGVLSANISGGQVAAVDGAVGSPAYAFLSDPDTGIYRSGSGVLSFTSNGVLSANISGGQITAVDGSSSAPAYGFLSETNTGMWKNGTNLTFTRSGTNIMNLHNLSGMEISAGGLQITSGGRAFFSDGSFGLPGISFNSDSNTGIRRTGTDALALVAGGIDSVSVFLDAGVVPVMRVPGQIQTGNGGISSQSGYTFFIDSSTGIWNSSSGVLDFYSVGSQALRIDSNLNTLHSTGTAALPSISFIGDPNTGIYNVSSDVLGISTAGTLRYQVSGNQLLANAVGTASVPNFSLASATNTGVAIESGTKVTTTVSGTAKMEVTNTNTTHSQQILNYPGLNSNFPGYAFTGTGGGGTGLYYNSTGTLYMGVVAGSIEGIRVYNGVGLVSHPFNFCFLAYNSSDDSLVTSGTKLEFDALHFQQGSGYNPSTDTFSAPITGKYLICFSIYYTLGTANVSKAVDVVTSNRTWEVPGEFTSAAGAINGSIIVDMDASDTCFLRLRLGAGSVTIQGDDTFGTTYFSAYLIA